MENANKKTKFNILFSIVFAGILLSFALLFGLTAILSPEEKVNDSYFEKYAPENNIFSDFNNACIKNERFHNFITRMEYTLFDTILDDSVLGGKNDFLFPAGMNEYGYNYLDDITGKVTLTPEILERFYGYILMRQQAYNNYGCEYLFVVIPNSQTVYSENLPDHIRLNKGETVLEQLTAYLKSRELDCFVDITPAMINGKEYGQLYNNTESSINALGAYFVYRDIVEHFDGELFDSRRILPKDYFRLHVRYAEGKSLAAKVGLEVYIRNRTLSLDSSAKYTYTSAEIMGDLESTYTKYEYIDRVPGEPTVLVEFSKEWDKVQLVPFFSSTFRRASYRVSKTYDRTALENANPEIVVQVMREDELFSILSSSVYSSYSSGLIHGQHPYETFAPQNVDYRLIGKNLLCVTGMAGEGEEINVFGDGIKTATTIAYDGRFILNVEIENPSVATQLCINAKGKGKTVSDTVYLLISLEEPPAVQAVYVGTNSTLYNMYYKPAEIPADFRLNAFGNFLSARFRNILAKTGNSESEILFTILPEKLSVYGDCVDGELLKMVSEFEEVRNVFKSRLSGIGVGCIDLSKTLIYHKSDGKLYSQTSDNMTDLASYYVYWTLMNRVAERYPAAAPRELDTFRNEKVYKDGGYLIEALGFDPKEISEHDSEIVTHIEKYVEVASVFDITKEFVTHSDGEGLPTAVIVRDIGCEKILELMAEHFDTMYVLEEGVVEISGDILKSVSPDLIIYICNERNISFDVGE